MEEKGIINKLIREVLIGKDFNKYLKATAIPIKYVDRRSFSAIHAGKIKLYNARKKCPIQFPTITLLILKKSSPVSFPWIICKITFEVYKCCGPSREAMNLN
ncbi:MAG: hypothetical protein K8R53_07760 [Bacteroidales bacterium]|nr:hypothetical protein [Bacteroidales bacterium]